MNKFMVFALSVVVLSAPSLFAGADCCKAGKAKTEASTGQCGEMFSKLNLTAEQQAKVDALKAECDKEKCTEASHAKFMKGLEGVLTAEQLAQCKELCAKDGKAGCGMKDGAHAAPKS